MTFSPVASGPSARHAQTPSREMPDPVTLYVQKRADGAFQKLTSLTVDKTNTLKALRNVLASKKLMITTDSFLDEHEYPVHKADEEQRVAYDVANVQHPSAGTATAGDSAGDAAETTGGSQQVSFSPQFSMVTAPWY